MQFVNLIDRQFLHRVSVPTSIGNRRWSTYLPSLRMVRRELDFPFCRPGLAALPARMTELDRGHSAHVLDNAADARETFKVLGVPDARAMDGGVAVWRDGNLFGKNEPEPARRA